MLRHNTYLFHPQVTSYASPLVMLDEKCQFFLVEGTVDSSVGWRPLLYILLSLLQNFHPPCADLRKLFFQHSIAASYLYLGCSLNMTVAIKADRHLYYLLVKVKRKCIMHLYFSCVICISKNFHIPSKFILCDSVEKLLCKKFFFLFSHCWLLCKRGSNPFEQLISLAFLASPSLYALFKENKFISHTC